MGVMEKKPSTQGPGPPPAVGPHAPRSLCTERLNTGGRKVPLLLSTRDAHCPQGAQTILPLKPLSMLSSSPPPITDFSFPLSRSGYKKPQGHFDSVRFHWPTPTPLNPKILLTGRVCQISLCLNVQDPDARALGVGGGSHLIWPLPTHPHWIPALPLLKLSPDPATQRVQISALH